VVFALAGLGGTAFLGRFARAERRDAELRRQAMREIVARAEELDPDRAEATLDRLHAERRRVLLIALYGGSACIAMAAGTSALGPVGVADAAIGGAAWLVVFLWTVVGSLRKLDRDFEERRADTRALLAERGRAD
jgi:hypothetical protein